MRMPAAVTSTVSAIALMGALAAAPARAQDRRDPGAPGPVTATVTLDAHAAGAGVGYTWGDGTLHCHGHTYHFAVKGISVADVGFSTIHGTGRVYNLHRLKDFTGTYAASTGEATLVNGIGGMILRNGNAVQLRIDTADKGARLAGSADGITLTLR